MIITVTEQDIKKGRRNCPSSCPVALALIRAGFTGVVVGSDVVTHGVQYKYKYMDLPMKATKFINEFDLGFPVKPIQFEIECVVKSTKE